MRVAGRARGWAARLAGLSGREARDRELAEELESHLQMHVDEYVRAGVDEVEARRLALVKLGGVQQTREECRRRRGVPVVEDLWQDLRYGARVLRKSPGFTLVAVVTLALGIGACTAIFSVVNGVLLRPLPYPQPERLVQVWEQNLKRGWTRDTVSPQNFADWQAQTRSFDAISAYEYESFVLTGGEAPERVVGLRASAGFFDVLGVRPTLGRGFLPGEDRRGAGRSAVLSHRLWQTRFGGRADALGQSLTLDGEGYTVVGVMPDDFAFPTQRIDLWVPSLDLARPRNDHFMYAVARLKPAVTLKQAQGDVDAVARRLGDQYPDSNGNSGVALVPLHEEMVGKARPALLLLFGAVMLMLLIACANVANLLLARSSSRRKEFAVRAALGGSRPRIVRQLLTESLLLALLGGGAGLLLGAWGVRLLVAASAGTIPRAGEVGLDARAYGFTAATSILIGILFGLAPVLGLSAPDLNSSLKGGGGAGSLKARGQSLLVVTEIAVALVLLSGSGLLLQSYARLSRVEPGFRPEPVLTARLSLPASKYPDGGRQSEFARRALERIRALPGVEGAGVVSDLPFSGSRTSKSFQIEGQPGAPDPDSPPPNADYRKASPDYLSVMGIRLTRGRGFTERDDAAAPPVAVVNEALARRHFPGTDPLGRRLVYGGGGGAQIVREIVGVAADVSHGSLAEEKTPEVYVPFAQHPQGEMFIALRAAPDTASLAAPLKGAVLEVDRDLPVYSLLPMRLRLETSLAPQRFSTQLLAVFASVAILLAAVGVFGVLSFQVSQRRREIGVRMALGARKRDVVWLVVGRGLSLTLAGVAAGLAVAFGLTRLMSGLLFGVTPTDPTTFAAVTLLLVVAALLACLIPASRATKVDPLIALRSE